MTVLLVTLKVMMFSLIKLLNKECGTFCLEKQPAKSLDTNVLDQSFFRALQAKQWLLGSETTIDGLIAQVLQAFAEFEPRKIDCGFPTLQTLLE
jgi:hypothetical protein